MMQYTSKKFPAQSVNSGLYMDDIDYKYLREFWSKVAL